MRALELIGGVVVAWVIAVGIFHTLRYLIGRRRANDDA
jgi:hypothetical protein